MTYWFTWAVLTITNLAIFWASLKNVNSAQELLDEAREIERGDNS